MNRGLMCASLTALLIAAALVVAGCGGGTPAAAPEVSAVVSSSGAASCDDSGFYLIEKATGAHAEIYDCHFAAQGSFGANEECVTYTNGVASDATSEVRLVFSTALNGKPPCLG